MTKTAGQGQGQGQERNDIPTPPTQKWLTVKDSVVREVFGSFWSDDIFGEEYIPNWYQIDSHLVKLSFLNFYSRFPASCGHVFFLQVHNVKYVCNQPKCGATFIKRLPLWPQTIKKGEIIKLLQVLFDFARHFCPPKCQTHLQLPTMQPGMFQIVPPFSKFLFDLLELKVLILNIQFLRIE